MPSTPVGFSDHSTGITSSLAAAALGAFLIEKHFTLDHDQSDFRDHQLSANPQEFEELVQGVRNIEHSLGDGMKVTTMNESLQLQVVRRSAAASHRLPAGTKISKQDIIYLRPGNGYTPDRESELLGQVLSRSVAEGETITDSDVTHS
jgi:sialic acid synthase SpsE